MADKVSGLPGFSDESLHKELLDHHEKVSHR